MRIINKIVLLAVCSLTLLSCMGNSAYEIRSPCVSNIDGSHPYGITPCPRKPANFDRIIT